MADQSIHALAVVQLRAVITAKVDDNSKGGGMFSRLLYRIFLFFARHPRSLRLVFIGVPIVILAFMAVTLTVSKLYQNYGDRDADRGAMAMDGKNGNPAGAHGENYKTPIYLTDKDGNDAPQGWNRTDSLWFYNTTQGSALLPYDFFLVLEQAELNEPFRSAQNIDKFRYLPQKRTPFNPDGLPVGFVKETYKGKPWYDIISSSKDYVGYTCAACHTGQINYTDPEKPNEPATAIRIDGGPAMADMVEFLNGLQDALKAVGKPGPKQDRFIQKVIELDNDYSMGDEEEVLNDLTKWTAIREAYNVINHSNVDYGFARLDAFGRIYNRVLKYLISTDQARQRLSQAVGGDNNEILTDKQVENLFEGIEEDVIIGDENAANILHKISELNLSDVDIIILRNTIFNPANAPVSYPFLWDIVQSTYVQWNGLANNAALGPLGRNVGEVIGVFGILDWKAEETVWSNPWSWNLRTTLSARVTGQKNKKKHITFDSSVDVTNLQRLERKLRSLKSPEWPRDIFGSESISEVRATRGRRIYNQYCLSCHEVVRRDDASRIVVSKMMNIDLVGTDRAMAENSVNYTGQSGNFAQTYQGVSGVGDVVVELDAPVVQMLTAAATGVITTPDRDKWFFRRWADRIYNLVASLADNPIKDSVKAGNYKPDTTAKPYNSLLSYKARSLNGIWATAPYLHNGSVPTLYDLLLPAKRGDGTEGGPYRPDKFYVGSREFDPKKVGFRYDRANAGFTEFDTSLAGNSNHGHEYGAGRTAQADGMTVLPALNEEQRRDLVEYLKTL